MSIWKWRRSSDLTLVTSFLFIALLGVVAYLYYSWTKQHTDDILAKEYASYIGKHSHIVGDTIFMNHFFDYIEEIRAHTKNVFSYSITEHNFVQHNPWIIGRLENTDYYRLKEKGIFSYDPGALPILFPSDTIKIPDSIQIKLIKERQNNISLNINLPEFKLQINYKDSTLYTFPIRVGQNKSKYLAMVNQEVDLRTRTGEGTIIRINKKPRFTNPVDNHHYEVTRRDDNRTTKLPYVPWLETELNGMRHGQLIHPTTNPVTLGKAYSNGCIGMAEADMWRTYYNAPLGTKVVVEYRLKAYDIEKDAVITLPDIYPTYRDQSKLTSGPEVGLECCLCEI